MFVMAAKEIPESMQNKCQTKPKLTFKMTVLQRTYPALNLQLPHLLFSCVFNLVIHENVQAWLTIHIL